MLFFQMEQPLVSIALCTYNGQDFLRKQLNSLLDQSYKNLQIVVCDDASTDATIDLINTYKDDRLVRHFNRTNIGYVKNFEQAISLCTGEFIALCDQDDMWRPDKIELL